MSSLNKCRLVRFEMFTTNWVEGNKIYRHSIYLKLCRSTAYKVEGT